MVKRISQERSLHFLEGFWLSYGQFWPLMHISTHIRRSPKTGFLEVSRFWTWEVLKLFFDLCTKCGRHYQRCFCDLSTIWKLRRNTLIFFPPQKMRTHQSTSEHFLNFHLFVCVIFKSRNAKWQPNNPGKISQGIHFSSSNMPKMAKISILDESFFLVIS